MKHIQTFESKNKPVYRGFREKQKKALSMSERFKDFIPSSFIIFNHRIWTGEYMIVFARILKLEHTIPTRYSYNQDSGVFVHVNIIDSVGPEKINDIKFKPGELTNFNAETIETLFISTSLKKSEEKYQEIAEEYIMMKDANKYNL